MNPLQLSHHIILHSGLDGEAGQTSLMVIDGAIAVLHRRPQADLPEPVPLAPWILPHIKQKDWSATLHLLTADRQKRTVEVGPLVLPEVEVLLSAAKKVWQGDHAPLLRQEAPKRTAARASQKQAPAPGSDPPAPRLKSLTRPPASALPSADTPLSAPAGIKPFPEAKTPVHAKRPTPFEPAGMNYAAPDRGDSMTGIEDSLRGGHYNVGLLISRLATLDSTDAFAIPRRARLADMMSEERYQDAFFALEEEFDDETSLDPLFYEALGRELEALGEKELAVFAYERVPTVKHEALRLQEELGLDRDTLIKVRCLRAVDHYREKSQKDPSDALAWERQAANLYLLKDKETAILTAQKAMDLDPTRRDAMAILIDSLKELGREEEARKWTEKILDKRPNDSWLHSKLANILQEFPEDQDLALAHCEKALQLDPKNSYSRFLRRNILRDAGRTEDLMKAVKDDLLHETRPEEQAELRQILMSIQQKQVKHDHKSGHIGCIMLVLVGLALLVASRFIMKYFF